MEMKKSFSDHVLTKDEEAEYLEQLAPEEEEEQTLPSRFSGEEGIRDWYVDIHVLFSVLPKQASLIIVMLENPPQISPDYHPIIISR